MTCARLIFGNTRAKQHYPLPIPLPQVGEGANVALCAAQTLDETNPRFANYGNFISSDYMLSRLNLDPALTQKRLGDGFYEQKLVSDQVTNLTGRRFRKLSS